MKIKLLGWRKFILTASVIVTSVILLICGKIDGAQFVSLNQIIIPAFLGANLIEWMKGNPNATSNPSGPTP